MNERLRFYLCSACVAIGAFHAPSSTRVLVQDLLGPYGVESTSSRRANVTWVSVPNSAGRIDAAGSDDERAGRTADRR